MITVVVTPGFELRLGHSEATRVYQQLADAFSGEASPGAQLPDDHPLWDRHSGGAGHRGNEWGQGDGPLAEAFYAQVRGKAKLFFDLLLDQPGRQLTVDDLIAASAGAFTSSFSVAGAINGLRLPHEASGRRYPFYWWEGSPSRYAVKPSVARLFNEVRGAWS